MERAVSSSPQPSVDRLSVTWAEPQQSMASSGVNLFHIPSETPINNEVKFTSPTGGEFNFSLVRIEIKNNDFENEHQHLLIKTFASEYLSTEYILKVQSLFGLLLGKTVNSHT